MFFLNIKFEYSYKRSVIAVPEIFFCFAKCPAQTAFFSTGNFGTEAADWRCSLGLNRPGCEADYSPSSSSKFRRAERQLTCIFLSVTLYRTVFYRSLLVSGTTGLKTTNGTTKQTEVHRRNCTQHRQLKDITILEFDILRAVIEEVLQLLSKFQGLVWHCRCGDLCWLKQSGTDIHGLKLEKVTMREKRLSDALGVLFFC